MDIEFGMPVADKNNQPIGNIGKIIVDSWTGKPRKYLVRQELEGPDRLYLFSPDQVREVSAGTVRLNLPLEELESA